METRFIGLTLDYEDKSGADSPVYLSGRETEYAEAYQLGLDHPVGGAGLAAFPALGLGVYPHNLFLEVFCEGGALGLLLLGSALLAFLRSAFRERRGLDPATVGALALFVFGSQASGDLYDSRALFLLMVMSTCTSTGGEASPASLPSVPGLRFARVAR
jgi:O-antigen ligase